MMVALGEMTTLYPVSGAFTHYSARFVDPALGCVELFLLSSPPGRTYLALLHGRLTLALVRAQLRSRLELVRPALSSPSQARSRRSRTLC